ncbi:hypothetical protein [Bacillus sp. Y1]|jgi:hypothetical protein|nr:hypothetical protein [Bacillus sp. Y1]
MSFLKNLVRNNKNSDCCGVEIKEVTEKDEKNSACCGGADQTKCC